LAKILAKTKQRAKEIITLEKIKYAIDEKREKIYRPQKNSLRGLTDGGCF